MKRKSGYYWVKVNPVNWRIGYFENDCWLFAGVGIIFNDDDFLEIDEMIIERKY